MGHSGQYSFFGSTVLEAEQPHKGLSQNVVAAKYKAQIRLKMKPTPKNTHRLNLLYIVVQ